MTLLTLFANCQHLLTTKCEMLQGAMKQVTPHQLLHTSYSVTGVERNRNIFGQRSTGCVIKMKRARERKGLHVRLVSMTKISWQPSVYDGRCTFSLGKRLRQLMAGQEPTWYPSVFFWHHFSRAFLLEPPYSLASADSGSFLSSLKHKRDI